MLTTLPAFASEGVSHVIEPNPLMIIPFVVLLLAIALMPFINKHWWEHYFPHVAIGLGLITIVYYVFFLHNPVRMLHSGIEYFSFICLVGSLFVVAGGMHINLKGYASPVKNTVLLLIGAVLSNLVGTTGASMILIRPFMRNNKSRLHAYHIIFFIFIVSNIGGALTPIGDPPLFLGYLKGIPFFWVMENVWMIWLLTIGIVLAVFIAIDTYYYKKVPVDVRARQNEAGDETKLQGMHNIGFLLLILIAVFIQDPPFVREAIMIIAAAASYFTTKRDIHRANDFNFFPIKEVGFLFLGLFATMVPALDWLELNAASLGISSAGQFYWGTGALSSFLDNAPTYLNFLSAEIGLLVRPELVTQVQEVIANGALNAPNFAQYSQEVRTTVEVLVRYHGDMVASGNVPLDDINVSILIGLHDIYVVAISVAAVFFGAMTYIGNAPNFMVKSIAEQAGAKMPSFFGYLFRFAIPILLPIFFLVWLLYFN
ncbi:MAG: sodium:proton antiporter [Bacteroidia bacterium]|nr:sodium:proton antiporter [Bacteroidia bacterium]